jgi:hypothetical protein
METKNNKKWWLFLIFVLLLIVSIIVFPQNPAHELLLKYLSTFSSWPIVILILILVFFFTFKESISELIKRLKVKTPQGYEIGSQPQMEAKPFDRKELEELRGKYETEKKDMAGFFWIIIEFERTIRILYRSQFHMLKFLSASKTNKIEVKKAFIEDYFYKNIYLKGGGNLGYSFESYLNFLKMGGYVIEELVNNISMIRITERGESFLNYCSISNYAENIFIPI